MEIRRYTLKKDERLCYHKEIEELFSGTNSSFSIFPLRVVFMKVNKVEGQPPVKILTSVSKRKFKRAVKRNRVKRQLREAYRKNKYILSDMLADKDFNLVIGFIWLANELKDSSYIEAKMIELLNSFSTRI